MRVGENIFHSIKYTWDLFDVWETWAKHVARVTEVNIQVVELFVSAP